MVTHDWPTRLDEYIATALKNGQSIGLVDAVPDHHIETGLAHVFFFGERVFKLYKTYDDHTHFIKGVFAPTRERQHFLARDHALNTHFSRGIYRDQHSVSWADPQVLIVPSVEAANSFIHSLIEMERLDFAHNVHELLLKEQVTDEMSYQLGWQTAELVSSYQEVLPDGLSWYELAIARLGFLEQFIAWLPEDLSVVVARRGYVHQLAAHVERHRTVYRALTSEHLTVTLDNHDENLFYTDGMLRVIDVLPPMSSWWYGPAYVNLANVMTNVGVMASQPAARAVYDGYTKYLGEVPPTQPFQFALALAHVISIAHFGSVPEKRDIALRYLMATDAVLEALD